VLPKSFLGLVSVPTVANISLFFPETSVA